MLLCREILQSMCIQTRNYSFYRNGNLADFFSYVFNGKKIKELFPPTGNKIAASVRCLSFRPVVLNARLANYLRRTQTKEDGEKRKNPKKVMLFPRRETQTSNSCRSFDYARDNKSIICFNDLCKLTEIYISARKKHLFTSYPAAKHQNAANLGLQTYEKNQWTFLWHHAVVNCIASNNLSNLGSFARVLVPVITITP